MTHKRDNNTKKRITPSIKVKNCNSSCSHLDNLLTSFKNQGDCFNFDKKSIELIMKRECGRDEKSLNFETTTLNYLNTYLLNSSLASSSHHQPTSMSSSRTYFKVFLSLSLVLLILCNLLVTTVNCMPSPEIPLYDTPEEASVLYSALNTDVTIESKRGSTCSTDVAARNVCERCAKATKVASALRFCCDDITNTREWCQKILNFKLVVEANTGIDRNINRMSYIRRSVGEHLKRRT